MKLEDIKDPSFLQNLSYPELDALCQDIRTFIVEHVSKTGGHLSSNLGVVELTVALHRVFRTEQDKLIFDVGHQSYVHKILTGRAAGFDNLRGFGGVSGFQSIQESPHDCYEGGHSSTSLSAALGFAIARDRLRQPYHVIAVIGDGSIGNGMAYEALNQIGDYRGKLIVILNDNEMSIGQNVGAVHNILERIRRNTRYSRTKSVTKQILSGVPIIGPKLVSGLTSAKKALTDIYNHTNSIFAEFGINYYGPIDGHNIKELESALQTAKRASGPVLLHVVTQKGRGYDYSQDDTIGTWHGVGKFDPSTGEFLVKPGSTSFSRVISDALCTLAGRDSRIMAITPAMATGAKLLGFKEKFPDRFIDAGMAEEHALVLANALALGGMHPFVTIYSTFLQRGYDQMIHDIARMKGKVVVGVDRAGIIGADGISHQGIYDLSFLLPIPNLILCHPKDAQEGTRLLAAGFAQDGPFVIRYSKNAIPPQPENLEPLPVGSWELLADGPDAVLISYGDLLTECQGACRLLEQQGIRAALVNARFLKPYDHSMFRALLARNKPVFVCEESVQIGSLGSFLLEEASAFPPHSPIHVIGLPDRFIPHGKRAEILRMLEMDAEGLAGKISALLRTESV